MHCKLNELRELVVRLACYAAIRDFESVGCISRQINNLLTALQSDFFELKLKVKGESEEPDESELDDSW